MLQKNLNLKGIQELTKEQLKNVMGGYYSTYSECMSNCDGECVEIRDRIGDIKWVFVGYGCQALPQE